MKKFMEIVKLQKNIEDIKKLNHMNNSTTKYRNSTTVNNQTIKERNDYYIGRRT